MHRRNFIKSSCLLCIGSIGLTSFLHSCSATKHNTAFSIKDNKLVIKKAEFTYIKKNETIQQKFILVKPEGLQFPIAIYQLKNNNYTAIYLQCSHQGCELNAYETTLVCPCHGAEFSNRGEVTQGPAEVNLKSFSTSQDHENIYIQL